MKKKDFSDILNYPSLNKAKVISHIELNPPKISTKHLCALLPEFPDLAFGWLALSDDTHKEVCPFYKCQKEPRHPGNTTTVF